MKQLKEKPAIRRVGFKLLTANGPSARQHMKIFDESGSKEVGEITSGGLSPCLKQNIAMGYISTPLSTVDTKVKIEIRQKKHDAVVVKLPFVPTRYFN